ncbi:hypothetical protein ACFX1X_036258 [Malus domestica]
MEYGCSHKQSILADLEWETNEEASIEDEGNGDEPKANEEFEDGRTDGSDFLEEEDTLNNDNSPHQRTNTKTTSVDERL